MEAGEEPKQSYYGDEFLGIYEEPQKILKSPKIEMPPPKSQDKTKKSKKPAKKAQISKPPSYSSSADSSEEDEKEDTQNIKPKVVLPVWKDIKISKSKQKELDQIPQGHKGDSKYVCKMLTTLWDSVTLIESSVTGNPARGPGSNWSAKPLDPIRLRYLKCKNLIILSK